jgi:hypothetical protein
MLTDFYHPYEVACLEQALLNNISKISELERIEMVLQAASEKLQSLIDQLK